MWPSFQRHKLPFPRKVMQHICYGDSWDAVWYGIHTMHQCRLLEVRYDLSNSGQRTVNIVRCLWGGYLHFDCQRGDGKISPHWRGGMMAVELEHWRRKELNLVPGEGGSGTDGSVRINDKGGGRSSSPLEEVCGTKPASAGPGRCELSAEKVSPCSDL